MSQVTEPVSIPFPTLSPAQSERIYFIASELPYKYSVEIIEMIKNISLEQYKAQSQEQPAVNVEPAVENPA